ncbi:MAG: sensor histidine kinase [Eubacteriales bacterium]
MRKRTFLKLVEYQTEQSRQHLEEVRSIYTEMRGYKHDFHHHLQILRAYLDAGEKERALAYLDELDENLKNVDTLLRTGNPSADAILSAKIAQAKVRGIAVTIQAILPEHLTLTDVELCIVLGNLLDNAIEACGAVPEGERFLRLYCKMKGCMLYFSLMNAAGPKLKKSGTRFASKKSGLHGFGLRRVENIIETHGGWIKYNSEDGAFTSEFLVPAAEE